MTICAAAYDSPTDYAIAADSHGIVNGLRIPSVKTIRVGALLIGHSGCAHEKKAGYAWLESSAGLESVAAGPKQALAAMRVHILATTERSPNCVGLDSCFIVASPVGIHVMGSDGGISETPPRWAIGCGEDVGIGAMFRRPGSPAEVVRIAVEAACALREGCFGEAVVLACSEDRGAFGLDWSGVRTRWDTPAIESPHR